jgi:hypothetical protein
MSTRRLPRTNAERLNALTRAKERKDSPETPAAEVPFTGATIAKLDVQQPNYKQKNNLVAQTLSLQADVTTIVNETRIQAGYFIADMLEAMQRAVRRGTFNASARAYYQLPVGESQIPRLRTEAELLEWGEKTIDGETNRMAAGGTAITFPDLASVGVAFTDYKTANLLQSQRKANYDNAQNAVAADNEEVDKLILKIWNEAETFFDEGDKASMRRKTREWGVVYVPSKGEVPTADEYSLMGQVTLADGTAVADADILLVELGLSTTTDTDGKFYYGILAPGSYTLKATKVGMEETMVLNVVIIEGQLTEVNVKMKPLAPPPPPPDPTPGSGG